MKKIHVPLIPIAFLPTMPRPISFSRRDKEIVQITWKVKFTDDSKYVLPSEDQLDWNKLCGLTFSPMFNAKKNSILIGWHYDPVKDEFRITPYLHDHLGKVTYLKPSQSWIIPKGKEVDIVLTLYPDTNSFFLRVAQLNFNYTGLMALGTTGRFVTTWFGGNRLPRNFIRFYLSKPKVRHSVWKQDQEN